MDTEFHELHSTMGYCVFHGSVYESHGTVYFMELTWYCVFHGYRVHVSHSTVGYRVP